MELLLVAAFLGLIPAAIAHSKGHSFVVFWFYGAMLFIVALPHSLLMSPSNEALEKRQLSQGYKKCPHCAELIKIEANVCRFCGREVRSEA